ncbi:MAG: leucine-rich repeat protein [Clostridiales bacterium]|jgi:hypothetical protein|nr:leucine-rich repeat protein [Clostridiales bacterium]
MKRACLEKLAFMACVFSLIFAPSAVFGQYDESLEVSAAQEDKLSADKPSEDEEAVSIFDTSALDEQDEIILDEAASDEMEPLTYEDEASLDEAEESLTYEDEAASESDLPEADLPESDENLTFGAATIAVVVSNVKAGSLATAIKDKYGAINRANVYSLTVGSGSLNQDDFETLSPSGDKLGAPKYFPNLEILNLGGASTNSSYLSENQFEGYDSLTEVVWPKGTTSIPYGAFAGCADLTKVTLPSTGVKSIGDKAFMGCASLSEINLPEGITKIGNSAFLMCGSLTSLKLPSALVEIGSEAFAFCDAIGDITFPAGGKLKTIGERAFRLCGSLTNLTLPEGLTTLGPGAFLLCYGLESVKLPSSLTVLAEETFMNCSELSIVNFSSGLVSIGPDAFENAAITNISLPATVSFIGHRAFIGCSSLKTMTIQYEAAVIEPGAGGMPLGSIQLDTLYVPEKLVSAYKNHSYWKNYQNVTVKIGGTLSGGGSTGSTDIASLLSEILRIILPMLIKMLQALFGSKTQSDIIL